MAIFSQLVLLLPFLSPTPLSQSHCESFDLKAQIRTSNAFEITGKSWVEKGQRVELRSGNGEIDTDSLQGFCRIQLKIITNPLTSSYTNSEIWIPSFNHTQTPRLVGVGNGGWSGGIVYHDLASVVQRGLIGWSTDTGHESGPMDGSWALSNDNGDRDDKIVDHGWRAVHRTTQVVKVVAGEYHRGLFGAKKLKSYWSGCSTGGMQGLKAAQEFPSDFDGVLVGSPASHHMHLQPWAIRQSLAIEKANMDQKTWKVVHDEVMKQCDGLDGVLDGVLEDPRKCHFRPETIACRPGKSKSCLTPSQITALKIVYSDYIESGDNFIFSRSEPGGELSYHTRSVLGREPIAFPIEYYRYFVLNDTEWDYRTFNASLIPYTDALDVGQMNAINPNLLPFAKRKGKVLHYFGWGDQSIAPGESIRYYDSVERYTRQNSKKNVEDFYKLFPVPGMAHCSGGEGPNTFGASQHALHEPSTTKNDMLMSLIRWAEEGVGPEYVVATRWREGKKGWGKERTRKLCPFPMKAVYVGEKEGKKGKGKKVRDEGEKDEMNFQCR